jgi:predicted Zn finger-like uncharacterized protein
MIHFQCPACAASFDVEERLAGRAGRCKKCGGRMKIPSNGAAVAVPAHAAAARPRAVAAAAPAGPRLSPIAPMAPSRPQPLPAAGRPINWLEAVNSQVALAPISMDNLKGLGNKPSPMDEPSIPGPYKLASALSLPAVEAMGGKPAGAVTRGYRHGMGKVQKLFRWINESAYLVSVPFLICLLLGLAVGNHSLMVVGATAVVLLNIGRILAGVVNLVVIPFRESPLQGILFLIPPITFFYMAQHWHKMERPVKRIIGPILTIGMVALAFLAEPWIRGEGKSKASIQDQVKASSGSLKKSIANQIGEVPNLKMDGLNSLERKAADALKSINAGDALKAIEEHVKDPGKMN